MDTTEISNTPAAETELKAVDLHAKLPEVISALNAVISKLNSRRDRGPESSRAMTEADARAVVLGEQSGLSHTKAAEALGLSYGQVYSARKGFTFKAVYKEGVKAGKIKD